MLSVDVLSPFLSQGKNVKEVKDSSGFIVNRILTKAINEACLVLEEGVSNVNDID